jgi:hypothetical protein
MDGCPSGAGRTTSVVARRRSDTLKRPATQAPLDADVFDQGHSRAPPAVSSRARQSCAPLKPDHAHTGDAPPVVAYVTPAP